MTPGVRLQQPHPHQRDGHAGDHGRDVEDRAVEVHAAQLQIEQQREPQTKDQLQGQGQKHIEKRHLERLPEERVAGEHAHVVGQPPIHSGGRVMVHWVKL